MEDMSRLYQQHAQTVYKFLLAQCRDAHLAEELTQETFYQAIRSVDRFNGSLVITGEVAAVEEALAGVMQVLCYMMGFSPAPMTRT